MKSPLPTNTKKECKHEFVFIEINKKAYTVAVNQGVDFLPGYVFYCRRCLLVETRAVGDE